MQLIFYRLVLPGTIRRLWIDWKSSAGIRQLPWFWPGYRQPVLVPVLVLGRYE